MMMHSGYERVSGASMFDTLFIGARVNKDFVVVPEPEQRQQAFFRESNWHPDLPRSMWQSPLPDGCVFDCEEVRVDVFGKAAVIRQWLMDPGVMLRFLMGDRVYGERSFRSVLRVVERDQWGRIRAHVTTDSAQWLRGLRIPSKVHFQLECRWAVPPKDLLRVGVEIHGAQWRAIY